MLGLGRVVQGLELDMGCVKVITCVHVITSVCFGVFKYFYEHARTVLISIFRVFWYLNE